MFGIHKVKDNTEILECLITVAPWFAFFTKHCLDSQTKEDGLGGDVALMKEMRNMYTILIGKSDGKKPLRSPKWEYNSILDLGEIWLEGVNWIHLAQDWEQWQALVDLQAV